MQPDDMRIPDSFELARKEGLEFVFGQTDLKDAHPNSVVLSVRGENGRELSVQASSLGGGRIMVNKLDGIDVNCSCEMPTLIVHNLDQPGHVCEVTSMLAHKSVTVQGPQRRQGCHGDRDGPTDTRGSSSMAGTFGGSSEGYLY